MKTFIMSLSLAQEFGSHVNFYKRCIISGIMPVGTLNEARQQGYINNGLFQLFTPTFEDDDKLFTNGENTEFSKTMVKSEGTKKILVKHPAGKNWDSGLPKTVNSTGVFTPLRQTIILLMAAYGNEL